MSAMASVTRGERGTRRRRRGVKRGKQILPLPRLAAPFSGGHRQNQKTAVKALYRPRHCGTTARVECAGTTGRGKQPACTFMLMVMAPDSRSAT